MEVKLKKAQEQDRSLLWNMLQFTLYDSSFFMDNEINKEGVFEYKWFNNYFTDEDRAAYIIQDECENVLGMAMVNAYLKLQHSCKAQCVSEFLILPKYRRHHIGKRVAHMLFDMYDGEWEVQPMDNNKGAYTFWEKVIAEYSNNKYTKNELEGQEDVFVFASKKV